MKKQLLAVLLTLASVSVSFAAGPIVIGDVEFKDELVILKKNIVCSAFSGPSDKVTPQSIVHGTYTVAMVTEDGMLVNGNIDDESYQITIDKDGSANISMQPSAKFTKGGPPAYSFSASGAFTDRVIRGTAVKQVGLTVTLNGRTKDVSCSLQN